MTSDGDLISDLTAERARAAFEYDDLSGRLVWKAKAGSSRVINIFNARFAGKEAGCVIELVAQPGKFYRQVRLDGRLYLAQRLIWLIKTGAWPDDRIDHRNLDGIDNTWANLREATAQQNQFNRAARKDNPGIYKGVRRHRDGKRYQARITINYRSIHLGVFDSDVAAARAYDRAARARHGEFARTNFPS